MKVVICALELLLQTFSFAALIDLSTDPKDEKKPIDVYAIGFEEMVDLDAKNIVNARLDRMMNAMLYKGKSRFLLPFQL